MTVPGPEQPVGRIRFMDQQRVNLDGFAVEDPELGLVALRSPHDPEPGRLTLRVPAAVPSVTQRSTPAFASQPLKNSRPFAGVNCRPAKY